MKICFVEHCKFLLTMGETKTLFKVLPLYEKGAINMSTPIFSYQVIHTVHKPQVVYSSVLRPRQPKASL